MVLEAVTFPLTDAFIDRLKLDKYNNLSSSAVVNGEVHEINLNYTHHPTRGPVDRLASLKQNAHSLKKDLVANLTKNIEDQCQKGTLVEFASAFDLHREIDLDERVRLLTELAKIYCTDYVHAVQEKADHWADFKISIKYPKKIKCTVEEIVQEFKNLFPTLNRRWLNQERSEDMKSGNL